MNYRCKIPINSCANKFFSREPIFQALIKKPEKKSLHCLSNKCSNCLNDYFNNNLQQSYNQIFLEQKDTLEMGRPNAIVTSPNITINDEEMINIQEEALNKLENNQNEIRKRFALIQMNDYVFILGGYIVDKKTREKKIPIYDYFYDNNKKELISIPPLPGNARMGFGLGATEDEKIIVVGGHNFNYQTMTSVTMLDTLAEELKWQNLPDMPNGTIGPGVSVIDNILYVIGGFDFIGHDILCNGDVFLMDLNKKQWNTLTELDPPRARPLISTADHTDPPSLIVAGGYNFDKKGKPIPYGKIEEYNIKKKKWYIIADIPNFKTSHGLATKNNKLLLMDNPNEQDESHILQEFNLETRQWENFHDIEQSVSQEKH